MWNGVIAPSFFTSALNRREWSVSYPGRFTPGKGASGTHWTGGCVGPRGGLDTAEKRKFLAPAGNRILAVQRVVLHYTD
jgi:hypothetical protein